MALPYSGRGSWRRFYPPLPPPLLVSPLSSMVDPDGRAEEVIQSRSTAPCPKGAQLLDTRVDPRSPHFTTYPLQCTRLPTLKSSMNQDTFMESISLTSDDFLLLGDDSAWLGNLPDEFVTNLTVSIPEIVAIDSVDMISPTAVETPTLHQALLKTQTTPRGGKQPRKTPLKVSGATGRAPRKRTPEQRERERVKKQAKEAKAREQFDEWLELESKFQHYLKSRVHRLARGESEESCGEFESVVLVQMLYSSVNAADRALDFPGQRQLRGRINSRLTTSQLLLPFLELNLEL